MCHEHMLTRDDEINVPNSCHATNDQDANISERKGNAIKLRN